MQIHSSYRQPARIYPEPDEPRRLPQHDTKKWCRGRTGIPHCKVWVRSTRWNTLGVPRQKKGLEWYDLVCSACMKKFDYCWPAFRGTTCKCGNHNIPEEG
jgi:hypothetical protein